MSSPDCSRPSLCPNNSSSCGPRQALRHSPLASALTSLQTLCFMDPQRCALCALWTLQKLCFMDFSEVVLYGLFKSCALWTLQKLCFMDSSKVVRYGLFKSCALWTLKSSALWPLKSSALRFNSCALWILQKLCFLCFMDPSKVFYGPFKICLLWTLQKLCFMDTVLWEMVNDISLSFVVFYLKKCNNR